MDPRANDVWPSGLARREEKGEEWGDDEDDDDVDRTSVPRGKMG